MGASFLGNALSADMLPGFLILLGYLLGSLPFAVIVSRLYGLDDPRSYGSGNPGATNVLRSGSKSAAILTLLGDAAKGWLAVWLAAQAGATSPILASVGFAALLGHVFPLFLRFKGGKGVATAAGIFLGFSPWLFLACVLVWLLVAAATRYSSLAALCAAVAAPLFALWLLDTAQAVALAAMSLLVIGRHQANIRNLLQGKEGRIGQKKSA